MSRILDVLKDAVVRSSQAGRSHVELLLMERERRGLYAKLGEQIAERVASGGVVLPESAQQVLDRIHDVEARLRNHGGSHPERAAARGFDLPSEDTVPASDFDFEDDSIEGEEDSLD